MDEVHGASLVAYSDEIIVELTGRGSRGDFAVRSYYFALDEDGATLRPRGEIETAHRDVVETTVRDAGYEFRA